MIWLNSYLMWLIWSYSNFLVVFTYKTLCLSVPLPRSTTLVKFWGICGIPHNFQCFSWIMFSWKRLLVKKVKFRHKISWLKMFTFIFPRMLLDGNHSHFCLFWSHALYFKRKKKYLTFSSLLIFGINQYTVKGAEYGIAKTGFWNLYTQRGFRGARSSVTQRLGKISAYRAFKSKIL